MQLIALHSSLMFRALKGAACALSAAVAAWLAIVPGAAAGWLAALAALVVGGLALRARAPEGQLRLRPEGFCELLGERRPGDMIVAGVFSGAGWLVLRLRGRVGPGAAGGTQTLVLAPDAASAEDLRRLRVWLNLAAPRADLNSGGVEWS